jgi:ABC-2 type transport system ATP-binding protein
MPAAVAIEGLYKSYGTVKALQGIDLSVAQGAFFGLLGPNGAGKSTVINIIAGLVRASRGTVTIMGHDVRREWRQARHLLGIVPQEIVSDPFFSVREVLHLQSGYFGYGKENHAWIDELLTTLNLSDKADSNVYRLSGGMKRRVLIAQALVHKPQVVVLDEPTAGVDVDLRKVLWDFTRRLHSQGHTIVLTTHYLEEAESLCERIAIVNHGRLIALDDTSALLGRYPYRYLCLRLIQTPVDIRARLPSALHDKIHAFSDNNLSLRLHREHDSIAEVLNALATAQIYFSDLSTGEAKLEDVFMALTHAPEALP